MKKQQSYKRISNVDQHETTTTTTTSSSKNNNSTNADNTSTPSPTKSSKSTPSSPTIQQSSSSSIHSIHSSTNNTTIPNNPSSSTTTTSSIQQKLSNKLHALFFIYLSYTTIKYTNTISIIFTSNIIIRPLLYIAIVLLSINTILFLYLGIYLPKIKGLDVNKINANIMNNNDCIGTDGGGGGSGANGANGANGMMMKTNSELWSVYCPRVIPIMTFNGLFCTFVLMRCFWPVWGFLTPFILGIEFFGLLFVSHFIPWC